MNKTKLIKTTIAMTVALSLTGAYATIPVSNVNDVYYFGPTGVFTQAMASVANTQKASIDQIATLQDIMITQKDQLQQDTDARNRIAINQSATAQNIASIYPTLQACADLSKGQVGSGAMKATVSGGSSGGSSGARTAATAVKEIHTESDKLAVAINAKTKLGTCSAMDNGVAGCSGTPGNYGGSSDGKVPSSDISPIALKYNTSNSDKTSADSEAANYSMNAAAVDVANQYIVNATLNNSPKMLPDDKLKANPGYKSLYDGVMIKLYAAQQAMKDVLSLRKSASIPSGGVAATFWENNKANYQNIMGLKAPDNPSLMDILMFNVVNDYIGTPTDTAQDQTDLLKGINQKLALSNVLAQRNLTMQENNNILLALLLTQATTPSDLGKLNEQYNKIMNTK